jgi:hypothetical protein
MNTNKSQSEQLPQDAVMQLVLFEDDLVTYETALLAQEKGFDIDCGWKLRKLEDGSFTHTNCSDLGVEQPTQSLLQKFIRETRGVHIEIHRNASGYYWSMCKEDGGTDLGWSDHTGSNDGGVWDSFEGALENALQVQLSYDLPNDITIIKHWGNFVEFALKSK